MRIGIKYLLAFASAISLSISAKAQASFTIYDGVNPLITVSDNGPGDQSSVTGAIIVQTNVGVWALTINTAVTKPLVGSATSPVMDINLQAFSTAAGMLSLTFSDNNFGPAMGTVNASMSGNTVIGPTANAGMTVWGDQNNVVGGNSTFITTMGPSPLSSLFQASTGPLTLNAPYTLTENTTVTSFGASIVNVDASFNVTPVPEPGLPVLSAMGFAGWLLFRVRNRRA
jgi:hypothetical protein